MYSAGEYSAGRFTFERGLGRGGRDGFLKETKRRSHSLAHKSRNPITQRLTLISSRQLCDPTIALNWSASARLPGHPTWHLRGLRDSDRQSPDSTCISFTPSSFARFAPRHGEHAQRWSAISFLPPSVSGQESSTLQLTSHREIFDTLPYRLTFRLALRF